MQECTTKLAAMSNREIAKQTTAFATDWVLTKKALTLGHSICSRAVPRIAEIIEVLPKELGVEHVVVGAEGMLYNVSEDTKRVSGAAKEIIKAANTWISKGGLVYGPDKKFGTRINHILQHTVPNAKKLNHSVFTVTGDALFDLIDFAWSKRGLPVSNDPGAFIIKLDKIVGTLGEKAIKIVVVPDTYNIITAYPIKV